MSGSPPTWSFQAVTFRPIDAQRILPRWKRQARINVINLLGSGQAEFHVFGHGEYRLELEAFLDSIADAQTLEGLIGTTGTLVVDGTGYSNVILMEISCRVRAATHVEASLVFARSA